MLACGRKDTAAEEGPVQEGLSPSARCTRYLECATAVTPAGLGALLDAYGWGGSCWESTQEVANQCADACGIGLRQLQEIAPDDPACAEADAETETDTDGDTGTGEVSEREVDLIFVVDNSGSMGPAQANLAVASSQLIRELDAADPPVDYRIAVTTTDNGNPWCGQTSPEAGGLRATSCRGRSHEFVFAGAQTVDAFDQACAGVCDLETLGFDGLWLDVQRSTGTSNVTGSVADNLSCMLPQGIDGCGFEAPLESMWKAVSRTETQGQPGYGFHRPGALLAVVIVTDEADCSYNDEYESIFLPDGDRAFWSDPSAASPTSAVCWNAGVACTGTGPYACQVQDYGSDGAPQSDPDQAVLRPIDRYTDQLVERGAYLFAIDGVNADGSVTYAPGDAQFMADFGIGPGCQSTVARAVPPVRIRETVARVSGGGNERSICDVDYAPAMVALAAGIIARLP